MKKNFLFALLMAGCLTAGAQTVEKKVKLSDSTQLVYAEVNDVKNGAYLIKNTKKDGVILQGNYKNDTRIGSWYFFDAANKPVMRYSYDQKKLLFLDESSLKDVSVNILSDDAAVKEGATAPLPLCPVDYYVQAVTKKVFAVTGIENATLDAEVTARVATDGTATYFVRYADSDNKIAKLKIDLKNEKFDIDWLPAKYKGQPVEAEFTVHTNLKNGYVPTTRRTKWYN